MKRIRARPATLPKNPKKIFYGWWIVIGGGSMQFYTSAVFWRGFQAFVDPVLGSFTGWSSGAFATAMAIQRAESSFFTPFVGAAINRFGPRPVLMFGLFFTGCGFILMSQMQALWHFYAAMLLLGLGMSFGEFIVFVTTVVNWFVRLRARALATVMTFSAMGAVALPLLVWMIENFGWRTMLLCIGIGFWVVGTPVVLVLRRRPEDYAMRPDGDNEFTVTSPNRAQHLRHRAREISVGIRDAVRLRAFWQIVIAVSLGEIVAMTNLFHLPTLLEYKIDIWLAAVAAGAVAFGDVLGRITIGTIGDRFNVKFLLATALSVQTVGVGSLALTNSHFLGISWGLIPLPFFVFCSGFGFGSSIPLRLSILAEYFGRRSYGTLVGVTGSISSIWVTAGLLFVGFTFDITDSYRPAYTILTLILLPAIPLTLSLESPTRVAAKVRQTARNRLRRSALNR